MTGIVENNGLFTDPPSSMSDVNENKSCLLLESNESDVNDKDERLWRSLGTPESPASLVIERSFESSSEKQI